MLLLQRAVRHGRPSLSARVQRSASASPLRIARCMTVGSEPAPRPFAHREAKPPQMPEGWKATTSPLKKETGLTGVEVIPHSREHLYALYQEIMRASRQLPDDSPYKALLEDLISHRMNTVFNETDVPKIEEIIGCGVIETLIDNAKEELEVIPEMARLQPWKTNRPQRETVIVDEERAIAYLRDFVKE